MVSKVYDSSTLDFNMDVGRNVGLLNGLTGTLPAGAPSCAASMFQPPEANIYVYHCKPVKN